MPVWNTPVHFLSAAVESVVEQIYPNWQLCIADDCSERQDTLGILKSFCEKDERIQCVYRTENGHISHASNSALELAEGEFVVLLDHDDVLAPEALYELVAPAECTPESDLIYSDEDQLDEDGVRINPFFKPDWSPDTLLSRMFINHVSMYRKTLLDRVGGFRPGV